MDDEEAMRAMGFGGFGKQSVCLSSPLIHFSSVLLLFHQPLLLLCCCNCSPLHGIVAASFHLLARFHQSAATTTTSAIPMVHYYTTATAYTVAAITTTTTTTTTTYCYLTVRNAHLDFVPSLNISEKYPHRHTTNSVVNALEKTKRFVFECYPLCFFSLPSMSSYW